MRFRETLAIRHVPEGVRAVRDAVRRRLERWDLPVDHDVVVLLVSELVSNAVEHGSPPSTVCLDWDAATLTVCVRDARVDAWPVLQHVDPDSEAGRGLSLLALLADRWGVDRGPTSKAVWFELRPRPDGEIALEAHHLLLLALDEVEPV